MDTITTLTKQIKKLSLQEQASIIAHLKEQTNDQPSLEPTKAPALTSAQQRIWFQDQMEGESPFYHLFRCYKGQGSIQQQQLQAAFEQLIRAHQVLQYSIVYENEQIKQEALSIHDYSIHFQHIQAQDLQEQTDTFIYKKFDLAKDALVRCAVLITDPQQFHIVLVMHHIISDGSAMEMLMEELLLIYQKCELQKDYQHPIRPNQYIDFVNWQKNQAIQAKKSGQLNYWKKKLASPVEALALTPDFSRPIQQSYEGEEIYINCSTVLKNKIIELSTKDSLFITLLSAFKVLLYRYTDQTDQCIGTIVSHRRQLQFEKMLGLLVNTIALRDNIDGKQSFTEVVAQLKQTFSDALAHQEIPFETIVQELPTTRDTSRHPYFQSLFVCHYLEKQLFSTVDFDLEAIEVPYRKTTMDLEFHVIKRNEELVFRLIFNKTLFHRATMERFLACYQELLLQLDTTCPIDQLKILPAAYEQQLLTDFQPNFSHFTQAENIVELLSKQAVISPNLPAVFYQNEQLTYEELHQQSNQLANYLKQHYAIQANDTIGILLPRNKFLAIAVLGILKAGAAYVPIAIDYPQKRIDFIIEDANCKVVLAETSENHQISIFEPAIWEQPTHFPNTSILPESLAYIIYTSGSTGKPKGVCVEHRSVVSLMRWGQQTFTDFDVMFQATSICWDLSVFEIFFPLSIGKPIRILASPLHIHEYIPLHKKVFLNTAPSVIESLFAHTLDWNLIRYINMAGERIPISLIQQLMKLDGDFEIRNLYGPSEYTTYATSYTFHQDQEILIGKALPYARIYLLNEANQLVPMGATGELCIGGAGIARGYHNLPELTKQQFIDDPFQEGLRLYKTGDLARWKPDGNLEFLGRNDRQVKIRGHRIETEAIVHVLQQHEAIQQACVTVYQKELVAFVVSQHFNEALFRAYLKEHFPTYMQPAYLLSLAQLPFNSNGKIDYKALPTPIIEAPQQQIVSQNHVMLRLKEIWEETLKVYPIALNTSFFKLGGNSILAVHLFARIEKEFKKKLPIATLFQHKTIQELAKVLVHQQWKPSWSPLVFIQPEGNKTPLFVIHGAGGNVLQYYDLANALGKEQPMYGMQSAGLDGTRPLYDTIPQMATRYIQEMKRVQPIGPYQLAGNSLGGLLAFEMAQQLQEKGEKVSLLAFFDVYATPLMNQVKPVHRLLEQVDNHFGYFALHGVKQTMKYYLNRIKKRLGIAQLSPHQVSPYLKQVDEVNRKAFSQYQPQLYQGEIVHFLASENHLRSFRDSRLFWDKLIQDGMETHVVEGNHTTLLEAENISLLVEKLRYYLD